MMNIIRSYSTNTNINFYNSQGPLNEHKINEYKTLYILPSSEQSDGFCHELYKILLNLDPDKVYKLECCMYLYTNNKNKQFIPTYSGMSDIHNDNNRNYFISYLKFLEDEIKSQYKFKGYTNILNNSFSLNKLDIKVEDYVYNTFAYIIDKQHQINHSETDKGYFEYKRPIFLIINKQK
jgi:hypothetical protein